MKFSTLEQDVIKNLCRWAKEPNVFNATRNFISAFGLKDGTGIFVFSKDIENRPQTILCIDISKIKETEYDSVYNNTLFVLFFLRKLENLGLVTISEGRYSKEKEYRIAVFNNGIDILVKSQASKYSESICSFGYAKEGKEFNAELIVNDKEIKIVYKEKEINGVDNGSEIKLKDYAICQVYYYMELFSRFETFDLIASTIAIGQELFDLCRNGFKTYEELVLEKANEQFDVSKSILEEAKKQSKTALDNISQAEKQFNKAQEDAKDQFDKAQKESKRQYDSANRKSICALVLAVLSIIVSPFVAKYVKTTIDTEQFKKIDSIETATLKQIEDINARAATQDSTYIYYGDRLDSISSTLQTINEKCNNKRPPQKNTH